MSTTPSQCRQRASVSTTPSQCRQPTPVSTTRAHARARRMPQSGLGLQLGGIMPPACLGDSLGRRRAPRDASDAPVPGGCPIFCCSGRNETKDAPSCLGIACARPASGERPHARQGNARTRARAGPRSGFPQVVRHPWGYAHKNPDLQNTHRAQGGDPALCAAPCSLIPFLVCDTEKERGQDPRGTRRTGHSCCTA